MPEIKGPGDAWPEHGTDAWNETFRYAQSRGWYLRETSDHAFGHLYCMIGVLPGQSVCDLTVYSSATATESVAIQFRRKIKHCPHKSVPLGPETAHQLLDVAESLMDSAERYLAGRDDQAEAWVQLSVAEDTLLAYEGLEALEARGTEQVDVALSQLAELGVDLGDPPNVDPALAAADLRLDEARLLVRGESGKDARTARERGKALRSRLQGLMTQVQDK